MDLLAKMCKSDQIFFISLEDKSNICTGAVAVGHGIIGYFGEGRDDGVEGKATWRIGMWPAGLVFVDR